MQYIVYGVIIMIMSYCIHELGHVMGIKMKKGKVRGVFFPFIMIYWDDKWKISFWRNTNKAHVLLNIDAVNGEDSYTNIKSILLFELICGPLFSIIYQAVLVFILCLQYFRYNMKLSNPIVLCVIAAVTWNSAFIVNSFKNEKDNICDYEAYRMLKNNEYIFQTYILEYLMISSDNINKIRNSKFLLRKIDCTLLAKTEDFFENDDLLYMLYDYLTIYMAGYADDSIALNKSVQVVLKNLKYVFDDTSIIYVLLLARVIQYLCANSKYDTAYNIYLLYFSDNNNSKNTVEIYYKKQTEYILNINDNKEYLESVINIKNSLVNQEYIVFYATKKLNKDIVLKSFIQKEQNYG